MCGIAGHLSLEGGPADSEAVRAMAAALAHRGPDGDGFFADGQVALGHRRLVILDLLGRTRTVGKRTHALITQGRQYVYGVGVLAVFALPHPEVFHGQIHRVHLLDFKGGVM